VASHPLSLRVASHPHLRRENPTVAYLLSPFKPKSRLAPFLVGIAIGAGAIAVGFTSSGDAPAPVPAPASCVAPAPVTPHPAGIDWPDVTSPAQGA
jgi:hypothetical protein